MACADPGAASVADEAAVVDALVIGGGPAGLTGALYLARFRRTVLVIDDGHSRAVKIPRSHNYPGFPEGVHGAGLVAAIREQALTHGVRFASGRVHSLDRTSQGFMVRWAGGQAGARTLLLATGASDVEPDMPHVSDALREGALRYCPVCDGYEVIGRAVGVLGDGVAAVREALYLRHFSERITLFLASPGSRLSASQRRQLDHAGITIVDEPVSSLRLWNGVVAVSHGSSRTDCDSLYSALGMRVHSQLAVALGAEHDGDGYLHTDQHQRTTVPGLYAAGDVAKGLNQISVATGEAAIAASAMHVALGGLGGR